MSLELSAPQNIFINGLKTKNTAYVGGFGCVHPFTKIHTEFGLMRICDIDRPMRVLSWNERDERFQLSLSGGAFPKGRANLYRVVTQQGEFVASGHHRTLCADGKYRRVDQLCAGDELSSFSPPHAKTSLESFLKSLPLGEQHSNQKVADSMGRYADEARLYGQQLLKEEDLSQSFETSQVYAQEFVQPFDRKTLLGFAPLHNHQDQSSAHQPMMGLHRLSERLDLPAANQKHSSFFARISDYLRPLKLSLSRLKPHCKALLFSSVYCSCGSSLIKSTTILSVVREDRQTDYWDMQVLDTNNYVTEDGCIHHNSGKTFVACLKILIYIGRFPKQRWGFWAPSYPLIRDVFYPTFDEAAEMMGFTTTVNKGDKEVSVFRGGIYYGTVICRSMSDPSSIVGYKVAGGICDEIDTMKMDKATDAWRKVNARLRLSVKGLEQNWLGVTTTPEGFNFVYKTFAKDPKSRYSMVQASTYENAAYLPDDYIENLYETYPDNLISAYLDGEFVNLTGGTVYNQYTNENNSNEIVTDSDSTLRIGMDFNVQHMAARVFVYRGKIPHCVDEFNELYDTADMIEHIQMRYPNKKIIVYPDSSGKNRKTNGADVTDIKLLKKAGFRVKAKEANPRVKTRINATNAMFCNANGERRLFVNKEKCPVTHDELQQQVYNEKGEPDKTGGKDHGNDAFSYFVCYEHPIADRITEAFKISR